MFHDTILEAMPSIPDDRLEEIVRLVMQRIKEAQEKEQKPGE